MNQLFISTNDQKVAFIKSIEITLKKLQKLGLNETTIANYCDDLFQGLNLQTFNAPVDLFIENYLFNEYSELRPFQFISLHNNILEGLKAVTDKNSVELSPKEVLSQSKIYNLVGAFQFKELFGIDFIKEFKATTLELKKPLTFMMSFCNIKMIKNLPKNMN